MGYQFLGFLQPIPQSNYKRGSTIPVKFRLGDATGAPISDTAAEALVSPVCLVKVTLDGAVKGFATYNAITDTFQYDLKTPKTIAAGPHTIGIQVTAPGGTAVVNRDATTIAIKA